MAVAYARELRMRSADVGLDYLRGITESLAGRRQDAARHFGTARDALPASGQTAGAALLDAYVTRELAATGTPVPGRYAVMTDEDLAALADPRADALTSLLCAEAAMDSGHTGRGAALARRAARVVGTMEDPFFQGQTYQGIGLLLLRAGLADEALAAAKNAHARYLAKGVRAALPEINSLISRISETVKP
jgi:hypothetical protein